jgi:hypothetical protein
MAPTTISTIKGMVVIALMVWGAYEPIIIVRTPIIQNDAVIGREGNTKVARNNITPTPIIISYILFSSHYIPIHYDILCHQK